MTAAFLPAERPEPGGDGRRRDDHSCGADLIDDLSVLAQGLGEAKQPVQAMRVLPRGDHGADSLNADQQPFGPENAERVSYRIS